jgi:hypothetical protein
MGDRVPKPTIDGTTLRQNRAASVVDIRLAAIEARKRLNRPVHRPVDPTKVSEKARGTETKVLFDWWKNQSNKLETLRELVANFRNRSDPPIEALCDLFVSSKLHWLVDTLVVAEPEYVSLVLELFSYLIQISHAGFLTAVVDSEYCMFVQHLVEGAVPPPPVMIKDIFYFWANLGGRGLDVRDYLLKLGTLTSLEQYLSLNTAAFDTVLATGAWVMDVLTSRIPIPAFEYVAPLLPTLQPMLGYAGPCQDYEMQRDVVGIVNNFLRYDIELLHEYLTSEFLTTLMFCANQQAQPELSEECMAAFVVLTNKSDKHCEHLLSLDFLDFAEVRLPIAQDPEHLQIIKVLTNILFGTKNLKAVILERPKLGELLRIGLDSAYYSIKFEILFLLANAFFFCKTIDDLLFVADIDGAQTMLDFICGGDGELSDMIIRAMHGMITLIHSASGLQNYEREKIVDFAKIWLLSNDIDEHLNNYISAPLPREAHQHAVKLIDRIDGMKKIFEMQENSIITSIRDMIYAPDLAYEGAMVMDPSATSTNFSF